MTKLYYSIKEISDLVDEEQHILRYWEKEFTILKPKKNKAGNRTYTHKDLQIIHKIKSMIRDEHYSLKEAKEKLKFIKLHELLEANEGIDNKNDNEVNKNTLRNDKIIDIINNKQNNISVEKLVDDQIEIIKVNSDKPLLVTESNNEVIDFEKNEDIVDFNFDKKIILKNHLFEDYEEFSIIDVDKYNEIKNIKNLKEKNEQNISNEINDFKNEYFESKNSNSNNYEKGIFLSYDSLKELILILKEIKQLII